MSKLSYEQRISIYNDENKEYLFLHFLKSIMLEKM